MMIDQANWDRIPLRSLCLGTTSIDPTKRPSDSFDYVDVSAVSNELWKIIACTRHTGATAPSRARKLVRARDVIFATVRPTLKRIAMVPNDLDGQIASTAFCVLRADSSKADPSFIFYSLLTEDFINRVSNLERGASYPAVTDNDILGQEISVPPLPEQQAIAAVLSKIQAAVEVQEKIVATLKELKAATMAKLFREGVVKGFMFDTHIFDQLLDGEIDISQLKMGPRLFVTHVQRDEIERCKDHDRREQLLRIFESLPQKMIPTESVVFGVSRFGGAKLSDDSSILEEIRKGNPKHTEDALIAETCIKQNLVLVTEEKDLPKRVRKASGEAIRFEDFLARHWRSLKQTEIGEIPASWEVVPLRSILAEPLRNGHSASVSSDNTGVPTLTLTAVTQRDFSGKNIKMTKADPARVRDLWLCDGDIFIERANTVEMVGLAGLYRGPSNFAIFPDLLIRVRVYADHLLPDILVEWLLLPWCRKYFQQHCRGAATSMPKIDHQTIENVLIPIPPVNEQQMMVRVIQTLYAQASAADSRTHRLKSLFSSMLHLLMTGQVRVNQLKIDTTHADGAQATQLG